MNKKEIAEIKKQFSEDRSTIGRIASCYVDGDKNIRFTNVDAFASLQKEEELKYYDLFRKSMSGSIGANLYTMEFTIDAEKEGGEWDFLYKLLQSELKDDELIGEFFNKVIASYDYGENYYMVLIHSKYDVPGKTKDGLDLDDSSDMVHSYLNFMICPVSLSKAGLSYNAEENMMSDRIRDWVVDKPMTAFMFPAFNERQTDLHSVLYFTKSAKEDHKEFVDNILHSEPIRTNLEEKATFNELIAETLSEECEFEVVKNIHDNIKELVDLNKDNPDPVMVTKDELKQILYDSGASDNKMENFEKEFNDVVGENKTMLATNLLNKRSFKIETDDIKITVNPERTDLIETKVIDGRNCLVIAIDSHLTINGLDARAFAGVENPDDDLDPDIDLDPDENL